MPRFWIELASAFGYGVLASIVPVFNGEAFIVAAQATGVLDPISLGVGLGAGQGVGKAILFQLVRQGKRLPWKTKDTATELAEIYPPSETENPQPENPESENPEPENPKSDSAADEAVERGKVTASAAKPLGKWRQRWQKFLRHAIALVEHDRWGPTIIFTSATFSIPPNYLTTLFAGTTKINFWVFTSMMTLGYTVRAVVESLIFAGVLDFWFK